MGQCKYFLNLDGVRYTFNSDQELSSFVRDNIEKKGNKIKFSKTGVGVETLQERIVKKLKGGITPYSKLFLKRHEFLALKHKIDKNINYLSPVFIASNYKDLAVLHLIETDPILQELSLNNPEEAKRKAEIQIQKELDLDKRMLGISITTTNLMEKLIKEPSYILNRKSFQGLFEKIAKYNLYEELKDSPPNADLLIETYIENNFTDKTVGYLKDKFTKWRMQILNSNNSFLAGIHLNKQLEIIDYSDLADKEDISHPGISSRVSYLGINEDGQADIFEIKVSRNDFTEWHSAKKITTDYALGVNKQLIENITKVNSLYVVPVIFPTKNDKILIDSAYIGEFQDRSTTDSKSGLNEGGEILANLQQVLPAATVVDAKQSEEVNKLNVEVFGIVFPKYNIRTKILITDAQKRYDKYLRDFLGEPNLFFYDTIANRKVEEPNTPEGREAFKKKVFDYVKRQNAYSNSKMLDLIKNIKKAKMYYDTDPNIEIKGRSIALQRTFRRYLSGEWEIVENRPELLNAGILIFKNNVTRTFEVISTTINQMNQINDFALGNTLLGQFRTNTDLVNDKKILSASSQHIELMKALIVLNNDPDLMRGYSLNSVAVINTFENKLYTVNLDLGIYNLNKLLESAKKYKDIPNNFKNKKIKVSNVTTVLFNEIANNAISLENSVFKGYLNKLEPDSLAENKEKLDLFIKLRKKLLEIFPELKELDPTKIQSFDSPKMKLYYLISSGITYYTKIDSIFDVNIPDFGISMTDWSHWVRSTLFGSAPDYDKDGNKVVGLFQGQLLTTSDTQSSRFLGKLHDIITIARNAISSEYNKKKNIIINATNTYYEEIGRSGLEKYLLGNSDKLHEVFFKQHNGKITKEFMLLNPWKTQTLNTAETKYLKHFIYFQYINSKNPNLDLDTFEKFEKSKELKELLETGKIKLLLQVPLIVRHSVFGRWKNLTQEGFRAAIGQKWDIAKTRVDDRDMTATEVEEERQRVGAYKSINGVGNIYNVYDLQESEEYRASLIEKYGVGHFERNLDTIGLKYSFARIRENTYSNVMPYLDAAVIVAKFYGFQSGQSEIVEKALENLDKNLKVKIHNSPIIKSKEVLEATGVVKQAQHAVSVMTIALRPLLMAKELFIGVIKNTSYVWSKVFGGTFEGKNLLKANKLLISSREHYEINKQLNNEYQLANRDLNQIVTRTKVDRFGLNFFSDLLFWFNTAPDYINRMSLFIAKMLQDGSYDAHSINSEGTLVYDPSKDKRFEYYFKKRNSYQFKQHRTDSKYNDQRSLYLKLIDIFNEERTLLNKTLLTEKDNLPRAYTSQERESIKSFTDLSYGHYDKDNSSLIRHTALGTLFAQYMAYWPSKVKYYLGKYEKNSKQGKMFQKYEMQDGKKIFYFVKYETNPETGETYRLEVPEHELAPGDPREKAWDWDGDPLEGLLYSLSAVSRNILHGTLDKSSPEQIAKAKIALHDLLLAIFAILLGFFIVKNRNTSKADKTVIDQYEQLALKIVYKGTREFDPFNSIFGSIQTTPAMIDKIGQTMKSIKDLASGNSDLDKLMRKTFVFSEIFPEFTDSLSN